MMTLLFVESNVAAYGEKSLSWELNVLAVPEVCGVVCRATTLTVPSAFTRTVEPSDRVPDAVASNELLPAGRLSSSEPSPLNLVAVMTPTTFILEVWMLLAFIKLLPVKSKLSPAESSCICSAEESTISGNLSAMVPYRYKFFAILIYLLNFSSPINLSPSILISKFNDTCCGLPFHPYHFVLFPLLWGGTLLTE